MSTHTDDTDAVLDALLREALGSSGGERERVFSALCRGLIRSGYLSRPDGECEGYDYESAHRELDRIFGWFNGRCRALLERIRSELRDLRTLCTGDGHGSELRGGRGFRERVSYVAGSVEVRGRIATDSPRLGYEVELFLDGDIDLVRRWGGACVANILCRDPDTVTADRIRAGLITHAVRRTTDRGASRGVSPPNWFVHWVENGLDRGGGGGSHDG